MKTIANGYDCRSEIKAAGGRYNGSSWEVTDEQFESLIVQAVESSGRTNRRDTAFGRAFAGVTITDDDGVEQTGAEAMAPAMAAAEAEAAAYRAKYQ